jgi:hypothetical protein
MMNNKLQAYLDYFVKYDDGENLGWYKNITTWIGIAQEIKKAVNQLDFSILDEAQKKDAIQKIIADKSKGQLKTVESFFDKYLFEQHNALGNIQQGVIWDSDNNPHKTEIKAEISEQVLIDILSEDIGDSKAKIDALLNGVDRNYEAATIRLLRALFPEKIAAVDAPKKLWRLLIILEAKLGFTTTGSIIDRHTQLMNSINYSDYAQKQIFFWVLYEMLQDTLSLKRAIVYYGAPGTGKTYQSKYVAEHYIDNHRIKLGTDIGAKGGKYKIKTIQFHPSYSYEDFMEGIRPSSAGTLTLHNGTFKAFCKEAGSIETYLYTDTDFLKIQSFKDKNYDFSLITVEQLQLNLKGIDETILPIPKEIGKGITISELIEPAFFIIDEINRAELSRVFGELMFSLEYRGYNGKIKTQYSYLNRSESDENVFFWENNEDWFFIPQNVFLIGTMNNIDRSVDSFDFALRRRFMWEEVEPNFDTVRNLFRAPWKDELARSFESLNDAILNDDILGKDYRLGHSYALSIKPMQERFETAKEARGFLWKEFIKSLLEEYLRGLGNEGKAQEKLKTFMQKFGL